MALNIVNVGYDSCNYFLLILRPEESRVFLRELGIEGEIVATPGHDLIPGGRLRGTLSMPAQAVDGCLPPAAPPFPIYSDSPGGRPGRLSGGG